MMVAAVSLVSLMSLMIGSKVLVAMRAPFAVHNCALT